MKASVNRDFSEDEILGNLHRYSIQFKFMLMVRDA